MRRRIAFLCLLLPGPLLATDSAGALGRAQTPGLQVALRARGVYRGPIDGIAGPQTVAAVQRLQERAGLPVDGVVGPQTRKALGKLGEPLFGRRVLLRGLTGWDVAVLQFELRRRTLDPGRLDGHFGAATEAALRRFQERRRLVVDGVAGPAVAAALGRTLAAGALRRSAAPAGIRYVVREGDTLTAIATRFGTTVTALARKNDLRAGDVLQTARSLRVPAFHPDRVAGASTAPSTWAIRAAIDHWSAYYGVDPSLTRALAWMESGYQPHVVSSAGALGVMQVTPPTWDFVEQVLLEREVPSTADGNVRVGVAFLAHLLRRFEGDERLALAAYYQGAKAVRDHGVLPVSRSYVANVLALRERM
ncbi:MAG: peptidoglycan-binding protein [Actinobacteria bacterium]|nr:peptidoglycan-binding protein [Actinomycetota bacterium]